MDFCLTRKETKILNARDAKAEPGKKGHSKQAERTVVSKKSQQVWKLVREIMACKKVILSSGTRLLMV